MQQELTAILRYKTEVDTHLTAYLADKKKDLAAVNRWGADLIGRLIPFVVSGKSIRGCLTAYIYHACTGKNNPAVYDAAGALELFQAGFLIHDDIMDNDALRRGSDSMHEQYRKVGLAYGAGDPVHFGISMGINAADLCFFMGYELLSKNDTTHSAHDFVSGEMQRVVIAQMQDVSGSARKTILTTDDVLSLYRYKTARYTFSLPMILGAKLAGADSALIDRLDRLGESIGVLFQIRDDELSVEGTPETTGKPSGSDERNDKQTLRSLLSGEELNELKTSLLEHAEQEVLALNVSEECKKELHALIRFSVTRNK